VVRCRCRSISRAISTTLRTYHCDNCHKKLCQIAQHILLEGRSDRHRRRRRYGSARGHISAVCWQIVTSTSYRGPPRTYVRRVLGHGMSKTLWPPRTHNLLYVGPGSHSPTDVSQKLRHAFAGTLLRRTYDRSVRTYKLYYVPPYQTPAREKKNIIKERRSKTMSISLARRFRRTQKVLDREILQGALYDSYTTSLKKLQSKTFWVRKLLPESLYFL